MNEPSEHNNFLSEYAGLLMDSYRRVTGRELVNAELSAVEQARSLWLAQFVVASHGTEPDPIFNYANRAMLQLFETTWGNFTSLPSRYSAEPVEQDERNRMFVRVNARGFIDDYSGVRITTQGRRFNIARATVWKVIDAHGAHRGQAVMFEHWEYL